MSKQVRVSLTDVEFSFVKDMSDRMDTSDSDVMQLAFRFGQEKLLTYCRSLEESLGQSQNVASHCSKLSQLVMCHMVQLESSEKFTHDRLQALMSGDRPTEVEVLRIALICGLSEDFVASLPINGGSHADEKVRA